MSIEVHSVLGKPYSPLNEGVAPSWLRMNVSAAASKSSVERPGRTISPMSARVPATIRPARAITSISRGDLSVIMSAAKGPAHAFGDLLDRADGGNAPQGPARVVPGEQRRRLFAIGTETGGHHVGVVVGALLDGPAAAQAAQDFVVGDVEEQHRVHVPPSLGQQAFHPFGLRDRAYDPVEDHALGCLG